MKRLLIHTSLLLLIGTVLLSCRQVIGVDPVISGNDKIEVSLSLNLSQRHQLKSRSTGDDHIDTEKIYLLIFDVNEAQAPTALRELVKALPSDIVTDGAVVNFTATLTPSDAKSGIYVVVNFDVAATVGTTFDAVVAALKTADLSTNNAQITSVPPSHPMISNLYSAASITTSFSIGTTQSPVKLYRNTVKVNASTAESVATQFELESIALYNAPIAGYVFPNVALAKTLDRHHYAQTLKQAWDNTTKKTGDILCYEAPLQENIASRKSPFVIIKGVYDGLEGYYRVDFTQRGADGTLNEIALLRNCIFTFNIKNVQRAGYETIDEAILNIASNAITYDVFVNDMFSSDIISNGEQYLGVSNSELVVHSDNNVAAENILAVTLSYTTKSDWTTPGRITCSQGIVLVGGAEIPLRQSADIHQEMDVYISLQNGFNKGTIMLSIGDLHKKIAVRRSVLPSSVPMTYDGGYIEVTHQQETKFQPILLAEVLDPQVTTWIRLATKEVRSDARSKIVLKHNTSGQPLENLYVHVWGNEEAVYTSNAVPRGYFYVSYANDNGRTRYCVVKEVTEISFNANGGHGQPNSMYRWVKQGADGDKAYILLPQVEPEYGGYIFKGWAKNSDGTGGVFLPNNLYATTFAAKDTLYARWEAKPVLAPCIFVGGLYWSVGNLVASGVDAARAGKPTDEGLMFKFGSLIGFDRVAKIAAVKPADCTIASPDVGNMVGVGYTGSGVLPVVDNSVAGVGDPCRYYLSGTWRLPTQADYTALNLTFRNYTNSAMRIEGRNEEGGLSNLVLLDVKFYREDFRTWDFSPITMYRTTSIADPFRFDRNGDPVSSTTGLTDSYSLGAVRCVRGDDPNLRP